ncbi:uncharacterized protein [Macrobrachium rosenbergii]|uniref:uncharacterized protein n=1 Tax=Macrobrachium rosenbergii TaxID=79674 RepID=UPI0034D7AE60
MKPVVVLCLFALAFAAPQEDSQVLRDERDNSHGSFSYKAEASTDAPVEDRCTTRSLEIRGFPRLKRVADEASFMPSSGILPIQATLPPPITRTRTPQDRRETENRRNRLRITTYQDGFVPVRSLLHL